MTGSAGGRETSLYAAVKEHLERSGYEAKGEVCGCDIVAVRPGEPPFLVITELKLGLTLPGRRGLTTLARGLVADLLLPGLLRIVGHSLPPPTTYAHDAALPSAMLPKGRANGLKRALSWYHRSTTSTAKRDLDSRKSRLGRTPRPRTEHRIVADDPYQAAGRRANAPGPAQEAVLPCHETVSRATARGDEHSCADRRADGRS